MLDPNLLRNESDAVAEKPTYRGFKLDVNKLGALGGRYKILQAETKNLQMECNSRPKPIGQVKACEGDTEPLCLEVNKLGEELDTAKAKLGTLQAEIRDIALTIPNLSIDEMPVGEGKNSNVEVSRWGTLRELGFEIRDHVTLGEMYSGLDFVTAVKLIGSRFVVMKGWVAHMHRALSQFMLDLHTERHGYSKNYVPYLVNQDTLYGTGQLPKFAGDLFHTRPPEEEADTNNHVLILATGAPLTNLVCGEVIDEDDLSIKMTAHTPCFRFEVGSYGRDTRGLIRMYQSDKVEMVRIMRPEGSMAALEEVTGHTEKILQLLGLPYRKIIFCTGGMGFGACETYDLKVWIPAQNTYREISPCSNVWDFQVRRMQACCRGKSNKKTRLVHTLNGSSLAAGRTLVVAMENYQ